MPTRICHTCEKVFEVPKARATSAKYCSTACRDAGLRKTPNYTCDVCGAAFHRKASAVARYARSLGVFCSSRCAGAAKSAAYVGGANPNYKGRNTDPDGYRLTTPQASFLLGNGRMKLHQAICCEALGIKRIPQGFHVHHRDCNILNNTAENLAVLSASDHKWLHKQYGVATLWAFCTGRIQLETLLDWSDDLDRAQRLLPLNVLHQTKASLGELPHASAVESKETTPECTSA